MNLTVDQLRSKAKSNLSDYFANELDAHVMDAVRGIDKDQLFDSMKAVLVNVYERVKDTPLCTEELRETVKLIVQFDLLSSLNERKPAEIPPSPPNGPYTDPFVDPYRRPTVRWGKTTSGTTFTFDPQRHGCIIGDIKTG